ncbi:MAG: hypothetical protein Q9160_006134 [Pyrenula sp. 1 TL-2023]
MDLIVDEEEKQFKSNTDGSEAHFDAAIHSSYHPNRFLPSDTYEDGDPRDLRETSLLHWLRTKRKEELEERSNRHQEETEAEARRHGRRNRYLPCHYFDYIGGTSTGGLIAILLGRLRLSVDDAIKEYEIMGEIVFGHGRIFSIRGPIPFPRDKYSGKRFVEVVKHVVNTRLPKQAYGDHLFISHERMCKTVAVAFDTQNIEEDSKVSKNWPYLFRSYDHHLDVRVDEHMTTHERNPGYSQRVPIWQVARATSAAPTYFNSITIGNCKYGDGGFGANNPTKEMYFEVCQMNGNEKKCVELLVSIGTGEPKRLEPYQETGARKYLSFLRSATKLASSSETVHDDMKRIFENDRDHQIYHRFNVPYRQAPIASNQMRLRTSRSAFLRSASGPSPLGDIKLDEWRGSSTLDSIRGATADYLSHPRVQKELRDIAEVLVSRRRLRSKHPEHWDIYSTGVQYRCQQPGCHQQKSHKLRHSKHSLVSHLVKKHSVPPDRLDEYLETGAVRL